MERRCSKRGWGGGLYSPASGDATLNFDRYGAKLYRAVPDDTVYTSVYTLDLLRFAKTSKVAWVVS